MPVLVNRQYAKLWASGGISQLGDAIFNTTLVLWVAIVLAKNQPWAPLAVGGVLLAVALPALLVAPLAGVFVDRWDFKRTMLVNDAIRAALVGGMVVLPLLGPDAGSPARFCAIWTRRSPVSTSDRSTPSSWRPGC